jgi:hypothetical protein
MAEWLASSWADVGAMPWVRPVAALGVLCIVIAFGFYVVSIFRDYAGEDRQQPLFAESKLQEMLRRGDISEAEFRTIQTTSRGVSVVSGEMSSPSEGSVSPIDASRDDEEERPNRFLPPSSDPLEYGK